MFRKRANVPIEQRNYSTYYIVFAGILFLGTLWAVVDEMSIRRPWRDYQSDFRTLAEARLSERAASARADIDSSAFAGLQNELQAAKDSLQGTRYASIKEGFDSILKKLASANRDYQFAKSRGDEAYYFYKKSVHEGKEDPSSKAKLEKNEAEMAGYQIVIGGIEHQRDSVLAILNEYRGAVKKAQASIIEMTKKADKWEQKAKRAASAPTAIKQVMMIDYDRNPFNDAKARIDRCQTCHLGWNEEVMEDAPQPFTRHPLPELLALHNPETFGCTPCHRGQGAALTPGTAHGEADHHWENPLLKGKEIYASCNACHQNQSSIAFGDPLTKAKRTMIESGCFGCHEIKGYTELAKIGPELNHLAAKTNAAWVYRWIKNPKEYNAHTRMPNFQFSDDQAEAVTAFLFDVSSKSGFQLPRGGYAGGNASRGRKVFESVGCQGCHVLGGMTKVREARATSYDIAPELTRVGSKTTPDWIYDWVRNPRHYNPTTRMPSLRLSDGEAKDVVAFLSGQKETRTFEDKPLHLASASVIKKGEALVREYGCTGCHAIQGMEKESRVSVSLSNFGRKRVDEMDFGDTKEEHSWHGWVTRKLHNARAFATERIQQKMPIFAFNEEEVSSLRLFLLSQTKDTPDERFIEKFGARQQAIEAGRRVAFHYNCQQCHELEKQGRYIGVLTEETAMLPPIITGEGKKVQEQWLHDFLKNPSKTGQPNFVRPWIPTRMPTFSLTDDEISQLTKYFLGLSNQELEIRDYASFTGDPALGASGKKLFDELMCMKCHPSGALKPAPGSTQDLAPNLTKARDRLKPEWIVEWLTDPNKLQEATRMPSYFPDLQSPDPDILGGDAKKQMAALRDYVRSIGQPVRPPTAAR